mgnify:CR=1 FL=1
MPTLGLILLLFFFVFILIKSADLIVAALRRFSKETHTKIFILSAIFLAVATSFPELFVGVSSALEATPHLSLGNVMGANIANISLVAGLSALIVGSISVHGEFIKHEVWVALLAGILPFILIIDGALSKNDGILLLFLYLIYALSFFKDRFLTVTHSQRKEGYIHRFLRDFEHPRVDQHVLKDVGKLILGLSLLIVSADVIVKIAVKIASSAGVPIFLVGLFLLSIGTTLPELVFSIKSLRRKESSMFFGNILGSVIANSTLILGITSIIHPINVINVRGSLVAVVAFVIIFSTFWFLIKRRLNIGRGGASLLLLLYGIFVVIEFL